MRSWPLPLQPRFIVYTAAVITTAVLSVEFFWSASVYVAIPLALSAFLAMIGTLDLIQKRHAVLRNYPLTAHIRFILEEIRPEIRQYFLESEKDGTPATWAGHAAFAGANLRRDATQCLTRNRLLPPAERASRRDWAANFDLMAGAHGEISIFHSQPL